MLYYGALLEISTGQKCFLFHPRHTLFVRTFDMFWPPKRAPTTAGAATTSYRCKPEVNRAVSDHGNHACIYLFSRRKSLPVRVLYDPLSNLHSTNYTELTTLRHERFLNRRALLESQAFAPIVDNARFARRIHDMERIVMRKIGYGVASE